MLERRGGWGGKRRREVGREDRDSSKRVDVHSTSTRRRSCAADRVSLKGKTCEKKEKVYCVYRSRDKPHRTHCSSQPCTPWREGCRAEPCRTATTTTQRVLSKRRASLQARVAPDTARVALMLASGTCETGTPSDVPPHPLSEPSNPRPDPKYCTAAERLPGLYVDPRAPQAARLDPSFGRRAARHGPLTQRDPGRGRGRAPCCSPAAV